MLERKKLKSRSPVVSESRSPGVPESRSFLVRYRRTYVLNNVKDEGAKGLRNIMPTQG